MVQKINFDKADTNKNGKLEPTEFKVAIAELASHFDMNKDGYISNGSGWGENGKTEFSEEFFQTVPFEQSKIPNYSLPLFSNGYSFYYKDQKGFLSFEECGFMEHAWEKAGGKVIRRDIPCAEIVCPRASELSGSLSKDDIKKSGVTWIEL